MTWHDKYLNDLTKGVKMGIIGLIGSLIVIAIGVYIITGAIIAIIKEE